MGVGIRRKNNGELGKVGQSVPAMMIEARSAIHARGLRYRLRPKEMPGPPDLVFPRFQTVLFIGDCAQVGHECDLGSGLHLRPSAQRHHWKRFAALRSVLSNRGWSVVVWWECELRSAEQIEAKADGLQQDLLRSQPWTEGD